MGDVHPNCYIEFAKSYTIHTIRSVMQPYAVLCSDFFMHSQIAFSAVHRIWHFQWSFCKISTAFLHFKFFLFLRTTITWKLHKFKYMHELTLLNQYVLIRRFVDFAQRELLHKCFLLVVFHRTRWNARNSQRASVGFILLAWNDWKQIMNPFRQPLRFIKLVNLCL